MYRRYLVLALLLASMIMMTAPSSSTSIQITSNPDSTLIETKLQMEIASEKGQGVSALLEFEKQLSIYEIQIAESLGTEFVRRGSTIVHVGRIYSAKVHSIESIRLLSDLGLVRATSGSKESEIL